MEGAESTCSFQWMGVLLYCVVFSSFPQKLWQVLCAWGVFECCDVTIKQRILWWCDNPCADTTQVRVCVLGCEEGTLCSAQLCWWHSSAAESQGSNSAVRTRRVCAFCEEDVCLDVFDTGARRHIYNCLLTSAILEGVLINVLFIAHIGCSLLKSKASP